ncbi:hypothetical protein AeMF1_002543 [Aphanomyces euteiches]|nr:hypothetical protein AeMF1_002543 [Aphanomyces euteiches]
MGYSDASWASRPDRKSVTGNLCLLAGSVVSWKSARQRIVALSTCEAEYIALAEVAKEIMWLRGLLNDIGILQTDATPTFCDNKAAIATAENDNISERSKHMDVRMHFIRQLLKEHTLVLKHVGTVDQLADVLTKVSSRAALESFRNLVMSPTKDTPSTQLPMEIPQSAKEFAPVSESG